MTEALIALALMYPLTVCGGLFLLTRYLSDRDAREARDRQVWANRVQAPETAIVQTLKPPEEVETLAPNTEWTEADEHERLVSTFTEGS